MIYFMQDETTNIKIGYTSDERAEFRKKALQVGNSSPITILATIDGDREFESEIHKALAKYRVAGEWFKPAPQVLAFIYKAWSDHSEARNMRHDAIRLPHLVQCAFPAFILPGDLSEEGIGKVFQLHCPFCGFAQTNAYEVSKADGVARIKFAGECGHEWVVRIGNTVGVSFMGIEREEK